MRLNRDLNEIVPFQSVSEIKQYVPLIGYCSSRLVWENYSLFEEDTGSSGYTDVVSKFAHKHWQLLKINAFIGILLTQIFFAGHAAHVFCFDEATKKSAQSYYKFVR